MITIPLLCSFWCEVHFAWLRLPDAIKWLLRLAKAVRIDQIPLSFCSETEIPFWMPYCHWISLMKIVDENSCRKWMWIYKKWQMKIQIIKLNLCLSLSGMRSNSGQNKNKHLLLYYDIRTFYMTFVNNKKLCSNDVFFFFKNFSLSVSLSVSRSLTVSDFFFVFVSCCFEWNSFSTFHSKMDWKWSLHVANSCWLNWVARAQMISERRRW